MNNIFFSISPIRQLFTGLKLACCSTIVTLLFLSTPELSFSNTKEITPERDISVVRHAPQSPDWKVLWDGARILVREEQFNLAAEAYAQLFSIKPNIEEANWEYCKILLQTHSYKTAAKIIALLLEKSPTKNEYLLVAGQVAAHEKNYSEAERYFGLIFEKAPVGKHGDAALEGLAYSLRARGLTQLAFPLMLQLITRDSNNYKVLHDMALDAITLKRFEVARQLFRRLLQEPAIDDRVIFQAASVFEGSGFAKERNEIYKRYLSLHPDYLPFRMQLIESSEASNDYVSLMDHLSYLIENIEDNDEFLLKAADVSLQHLKRPDKALVYLGQYQRIHPENSAISTKIDEIQELMAHEFLSIVENGGAELLWGDLASTAANRQLIFIRMAELLESHKKHEPLISVLEVLHKNGVNQNKIAFKLSKLHYDRQRYETSFDYLDSVPSGEQDYEYFELRAEVELQLGMEVAALESLLQYLAVQPLQHKHRRKAIELAGNLGQVDIQLQLFDSVAKNDIAKLSDELLLTHLEMLCQNKIFGQALDLCERAIAGRSDSVRLLDFYLLQTKILRKSDRKRRAEQILRQLLDDQRYQAAVLLELVANAIDDNNLAGARKWFSQFDRRRNNFLSNQESILTHRKKHLTNVRLLRLEGDAAEAKKLIDQALTENSNIRSSESKWYYSSLLKEQFKLYLAEGDILAADKLLEGSINEFDIDPGVIALRLMYSSPRGVAKDAEEILKHLERNGKIVISKAFDVAEQEIENQDYKIAEDLVSHIDYSLVDSVRLTNIKIQLYIASGNFEAAMQDIEKLENRFPAESSFCRQSIEIIAKSGNFDEALDTLMRCFPGSWPVAGNVVDDGALELEVKILYARLLWGAKQFEDSLAVYSELIEPPVYRQLINELKQKNIDYQYLTRHQTFWSSILLLVESDPEIIAELMEPTFLIDNIGSETGKIVSSFYEQYSWQRLIEDEFLARKATFNKKYHFAVKSYEKLVAQEETTENKVELAAIYGRIGEYRKEAQVYEEITNEGDVTPELKESIKRNILQIRPTNTIDAELEERDGRKGLVDIRKTSIGTSFWFTPDLDKDFWLKYAYNNYQSTDRNGEIASNIILGAMTYEFGDSYEFIAGLGAEKFNDSSDSEIQYNFELNGQLDDYVSGFILYQKAPVDDTIAAINDDIFRQYIQTGLTIETEIGITFGGDLQYSLYSDDNERNRFYGFSSYSIFGESLQFDVRYSYQYLANKDINGPDGFFSVNVNDDFITTYWSPESYSEHRLGLQFKKDFFGYLTDLENKMSYFRFDTGISLEDQENVAYSAKFDIFLEMSDHLLLKGNFSFNSSDIYNEKMLSLSLHYSW